MILIVDDDEGDRTQIRRVLRQAGLAADCVEAASVDEAVACSDQGPFELAIVDYQMPGTNGIEGIGLLHERMPDLPIIMATGYGDETTATEAMKRGALDYIPKRNIEPELLKRMIGSVLEKAALQRKLAEQRKELELFASVLAHDLKGSITAVRGFARLAEAVVQAEAVDKAKLVELCRRTARATERMDSLISALREYTRADAKVLFAAVDMNRVMEDALRSLQPRIEASRARVTCGELPTVTGSAAQLEDLLQNLIDNGIKYNDTAAPTVDISAVKSDNNTWLFAVKDNGIGIPPEAHGVLFEPFKRLHDQSKYPGTGLGLATCRKIVERHGGKIWFESANCAGTSFFFTLPGVAAD